MNIDKLRFYHVGYVPPIGIVAELKKKKANPQKIEYYKEVWLHTEQVAPQLENILLRGTHWHIDHIIPISIGFKTGILPSVIGGLSNLRVITMVENFKKAGRLLS